MLDPESVDLDELCAALDDRTPGVELVDRLRPPAGSATSWPTSVARQRRGSRPGPAGAASGAPSPTRATATWPSRGRGAPPPGRRPAGPGDQRARGVPPVQEHAVRVPGAPRPVVPLPRRPGAAAGAGLAGREGLVDRRRRAAVGRSTPTGIRPRRTCRRRWRWIWPCLRARLRQVLLFGSWARRRGLGRVGPGPAGGAQQPGVGPGTSCAGWTTCCGGTPSGPA